jgi:serine/threonine protein kinase
MTEPTSPLAPRLSEALGTAFTIEGEIGRGGMGVVYRARDEKLKRRVAIKVLPPELAFQAEIRARFTREAETAARLSHPHIVPIYTVGEGNGLVYFVMGYVDGESLAGRLKRRGKLPVEEVRRIMKETADALSAAHAMSVIHRDIKPDNILLSTGSAVVTDFGVAKAITAARASNRRSVTPRQPGRPVPITGIGLAVGTPAYMAPEQAAGDPKTDTRADLYALGVVGYEMLTGTPPFQGTSPQQVLAAQMVHTPPSIASRRYDVPAALVKLLDRLLSKEPSRRPSSAADLVRSLEDPELVSGAFAIAPTRLSRRLRYVLTGGVSLAVGLLLGWLLFGR